MRSQIHAYAIQKKNEIKCLTCSFSKKCSREYKVFCFYTHIKNLDSIMTNGIMCKNLLDNNGVSYKSMAIDEIQETRHDKIIFNNKTVHDFSPLYIKFFAPMIHNLVKRENKDYKIEDIVIIGVNCKIIASKKLTIYYSDGNMGANASNAYPIEEWDKNLDTTYLFGNGDNWDNNREAKRKASAEILVLDKIPVKYFKYIYTNNEETAKIIRKKYGITTLVPNHFKKISLKE